MIKKIYITVLTENKLMVIFNFRSTRSFLHLQLYNRQKEDPPIPRDMPPIAGKIAWSRLLYKKISEPMHRFAVSM